MNGYPSRARVPAPDPLAGLREALRTARPDADTMAFMRALRQRSPKPIRRPLVN